MIVIIEGFDNSGKSTLAKRLSEELNLEVVHPGGPPKNIAEVILRMNEQQSIFTFGTYVDFIYDRVTCISDQVYRQDKSYDTIFKYYISILEQYKSVMLIYCRPSLEQMQNFDDHVMQAHDTAEIVEHAKQKSSIIIAGYDKLIDEMYRSKMLINTFNFESEDAEKIYQRIKLTISQGLACNHEKT